MFVKEFLKVNDAKFTSADLADLIILLTNNKKAKDLLIEKPTESNKTKKSKKKSKKEQLEQNKKHADLFGEAEAGEYDNYEDQYDDSSRSPSPALPPPCAIKTSIVPAPANRLAR
ncbi:alpha-methylacyl-CoA racemase [Aureococcus anophagefferens]|nr:alpha-methylacyl-CoA racemase [Aureococcus anophagefferens]